MMRAKRIHPDETDQAIAGRLPVDPGDGTREAPSNRAVRAAEELGRIIRRTANALTPDKAAQLEALLAPVARFAAATEPITRTEALAAVRAVADNVDGAANDAEGRARGAEPPDSTASITPSEIIDRWESEGPLVRMPTGIRPLDDACRGGLPVPWRMILIGAPSAGKTWMAVTIADVMARDLDAAGLAVGVLAVDEEPDDLTVRLAQIAGFTVEQAERRDPETLARMRAALGGLRIRLYDARYTIDAAAADLGARAASQGRRAVLFIDSIQAARSAAALGADSPREQVEGNVAAMRAASTEYRMLVIATAEANRGSYRSETLTEQVNDMAAGAESRAIEYGAQTLLMLRTPKGHPNVIHARIVKNRRATTGVDFWLRLDRDRHTLTECPDPTVDPTLRAEEHRRAREGIKAAVVRDADELLKVLRKHPAGIGEKALRAALPSAGLKWGVERTEAAKAVLADGHRGVRLVDRGNRGKGTARVWCLESADALRDTANATRDPPDTIDASDASGRRPSAGGTSAPPDKGDRPDDVAPPEHRDHALDEDGRGIRAVADRVPRAEDTRQRRASPSTSMKPTTMSTKAPTTKTPAMDAVRLPDAMPCSSSELGIPIGDEPPSVPASPTTSGNLVQERREQAILNAVRSNDLASASAIWSEIGGKRAPVLALIKAMLADGRLSFDNGRFCGM
jgi:hypothetical protein